jgi:HlyD family secretion protein
VRKALLVAGLILSIAVAAWLIWGGKSQTTGSYRFVTLEQGDVEEVVASTGTLNPVTTVQVGTQVSGIIAGIFADFNDHVRKGQVIAQVDTTLLTISVRDAQAGMERSEAELRQAEREYRRLADLYQQNLVAETDFNTAQYNLDVARASVKSARAALQRSQQNLDYSTIHAPISGTVIERNVDVGQTVQASFSAPQLFLIAADLSQMQILAAVDESDIGQIAEGQEARFYVQAYPERTFTGAVRQVRLQSTTEENVVNYTAVVNVANPDGVLLPGMTATVDFLVATARDVLKIPNAALRFRPSEEMIAALRAQRQKQRQEQGGAAEHVAPAAGATAGFPAQGPGSSEQARQRPTLLWFLDERGAVTATPVQVGISDGQSTEVSGRNLKAGMQIIAGISQSKTAENGSTSPFQQTQQSGGPPRPGGF